MKKKETKTKKKSRQSECLMAAVSPSENSQVECELFRTCVWCAEHEAPRPTDTRALGPPPSSLQQTLGVWGLYLCSYTAQVGLQEPAVFLLQKKKNWLWPIYRPRDAADYSTSTFHAGHHACLKEVGCTEFTNVLSFWCSATLTPSSTPYLISIIFIDR